MRTIRQLSVASLVGVLLIPTSTSRIVCGTWSLVASPSSGAQDFLADVTAVPGSSEVWAVGQRDSRAFAERWDGSAWQLSRPRNNGRNATNQLEGVAAAGPADVWSVGFWRAGLKYQTLIEQWRGDAWAIVPSPNRSAGDNLLYGTIAFTPSDAWAVGSGTISPTSTTQETLIEHWDGSTWQIVLSADPGPWSVLTDIHGSSPTDLWAVGEYSPSSFIMPYLPFVEHWDGTAWTATSLPVAGQGSTARDVFEVASNDVWVVGYYSDGTQAFRTLTEHWDGSAWTIIPSPNSSEVKANLLFGVTAVNASEVWAVGFEETGFSPAAPISIHWDGSAWQLVPPVTIQPVSELTAATVGDNGVIWAVGQHTNSSGRWRTLVESAC